MRAAARAYMHSLERRPMLTKSSTSLLYHRSAGDVSAALAGVCARCTGELSGYAINQTTVARSTSKRKKEEILARNSTYYWFYRSSLQVRLFRTHDFHLKAAG